MIPPINRYNHKLIKFGQSESCDIRISKHIIHNFSLYDFLPEEIEALTFKFDQLSHIT